MGFKREDALSPKWRIGCKATQTVDPVVGRDLYVKGADKYRMSPFFQERGKSKKAIGRGKREMMPFYVLFFGSEYPEGRCTIVYAVYIVVDTSKRGNGKMQVHPPLLAGTPSVVNSVGPARPAATTT